MESASTLVTPRMRRDWLVVPVLLLASLLILALFHIYRTWPTTWKNGGPEALDWAGSSLMLSKGQGYDRNGILEIEKLADEGIAIASLSPKAFRARDYSTFTWRIDGAPPDTQFALLWRTTENSDRVFTTKAKPVKDGVVSWNMDRTANWQGQIRGVALLVKGELKAPISVKSLSARPVSILDAFEKMVRGWFSFQGWEPSSINYLDGEALDQEISLPMAVAAAVFLVVIVYFALVRFGLLQGSAVVLSCIIFLGWFVLDARWQWILFRQLEVTHQQFVGKSIEDKHLVMDGPLAKFLQQASLKMAGTKGRVLYLSDDNYLLSKGRYYLYPQNVLAFNDLAAVHHAKPGDYVVVFAKKGTNYDSVKQALVWEGPSSRPADLLLSDTGNLLVRIR